MGRDLLAKVGASIPFAPPFPLTPSSPATPLLLLLATQPTGCSMSFLLSASQVEPQYSSTAEHPSPSHPITRCYPVITQVQYPLSLWKLRGLKPIISDFLRNKLLHPTFSSFKTPILAV